MYEGFLEEGFPRKFSLNLGQTLSGSPREGSTLPSPRPRQSPDTQPTSVPPPPPQLQFRILVSMSVAEGIQRLAAAGWAGPGKAGCEEHGNELMQRRSPPQRSAQSPPAEQRKGERGWEQEGEGRRGQRCQLEDTLPCWYSLHVPWSPTTTAREEI